MKTLHTMIRVENLEKSVAFYKDALGYVENRVKDYPDGKFTLVFMSLPGDTQELELTYNYGHGKYELGEGYGHIALECENFEELYEQLQEKGYEVTKINSLSKSSSRYFFVKDPDGYKIEIIEEKN